MSDRKALYEGMWHEGRRHGPGVDTVNDRVGIWIRDRFSPNDSQAPEGFRRGRRECEIPLRHVPGHKRRGHFLSQVRPSHPVWHLCGILTPEWISPGTARSMAEMRIYE